MRPHPALPLLACILGILAPSVATARVLRVSSAGAAKFTNIQSALDAAEAGDTVRVAPGIYRERIRFRHGGRSGAPIVLDGEPGAILDASSPVELRWQPAPDIGEGVYRAPLDWFPFTVTADGKIVTTLDEKRTSTPDAPPPPHGWKRILWREAFVHGVGPSGWEGVKALAMYRHAERELLLRFGDLADPRTRPITVAPRDPAILISGVDRCVVRGLAIRNAATGVLIERSLGSVVENCEIDPADFGIRLTNDADRCIVRFNRISLRPFAGADPRAPGAWDNWQAMKTGGFYDRTGIGIGSTRGGHLIHDNHVHDHWDGISDFGNPPWASRKDPTENTGLRVHHNRIENLADDGFETMGPGVDGWWHDNLVIGARCAFRIKAPQRGPLYIYRNFFANNLEDLRHWGQGEQMYPEAEVWVYHNTSTSDAAVTMNYGATVIPVSTPRYHYANNLFWCLEWLRRGRRDPLPDWKSDHNVFVSAVAVPRPWDPQAMDDAETTRRLERWQTGHALAAEAGLDQESMWIENTGPGFAAPHSLDFSLTADSPARGRGVPLAKLRAEPLPGFPPASTNAPSPDAGALPHGEPMPSIPRSRDSMTDLVKAGFWP